MMQYRTRDGDVLDWIVWHHYRGRVSGVVEQVLAANPGLGDYGPVLPAGLVLDLPDIPPPAPQTRIQIWG